MSAMNGYRVGNSDSTVAMRAGASLRLWRGSWRQIDLGRWITLASFGLAVLSFLAAPFLALAWGSRPFLGFLVEHTLVISGVRGETWPGAQAGLDYPQRIFRLSDQLLDTSRDYAQAISRLSPGDRVTIQTVLPDGTTKLYPEMEVGRFPNADWLRMFWPPYLVGLAHLAIGLWVFLNRGKTAPGRAFAYFCVHAGLVAGLFFDIETTHFGTGIWTVAISQLGGSLTSLALAFPQVPSAVKRRAWLRFLPYLVSAALSVWGLVQLFEPSDPWAYVVPWRFSYYYAALGILLFLGVMLYRQYSSPPGVARQQVRIILAGSLVAFVPVGVWLVAPLFSMVIHFKPSIFMPLLLAFPLATGIAILRYRMWDLDVIINRTLVYGLVSLILAAVYFAVVLLVHRMLNDYVQLTTEITSVSSALLIVALFNPLRRRVQDFIDRRFYRRKYDAAKTLAAFTRTLQAELDLTQLLGRMAEVIWDTIMPARALVWLKNGASFQVIPVGDSPLLGEPHPPLEKDEIPASDLLAEHFYRHSNPAELEELDFDTPGVRLLQASGITMCIPLINQGELIGWIGLGRRMSRAEYSGDDRQLLANLAFQAAPALRVAQMVQQQRAEALKRERLEHELRLASEIQLALLPKRLPDLGGWQLSAHYQPARAVGGDFYDFIHLNDGRLGIFIGDVTDKGVPAALLMATTRTLLRAVAQNVTSPGLVLEQVNDMLHQEIPDNMFVTCLYIILDPASGRVQFANAGHNLPLHWTCDSLSELRTRGMPLGLMPEMAYEEKEARIGPGECLFLYSDGLVEAHNAQREMFGTDRLASVMAELHDDRFPLIDCLLEALQDFTGVSLEQEDDITLVALKRSSMEKCP